MRTLNMSWRIWSKYNPLNSSSTRRSNLPKPSSNTSCFNDKSLELKMASSIMLCNMSNSPSSPLKVTRRRISRSSLR